MNNNELNLKGLSDPVYQICQKAGEAILDIYQSKAPVLVEKKSDSSPLTIADRCAHDIIVEGLGALGLGWPILSEEHALPEFIQRQRWSRYWLVDPLDGTKEFIERTGDFTVNVALIENGKPLLGVVYVPLSREGFVGLPTQGVAQKRLAETECSISVSAISQSSAVRVLTSRRYGGDELEACLERLQRQFASVEHIRAGSALKFCRLAEGLADIYPRFSPCCEWDTAAGQAVLEAAGGALVDMDFKPFSYNQRESILNSNFYAVSADLRYWRRLLSSESSP